MVETEADRINRDILGGRGGAGKTNHILSIPFFI